MTQCNEPHLGLATTRELLDEIRARANYHPPFNMNPIGKKMHDVANELLGDLPEAELAYRTVDS